LLVIISILLFLVLWKLHNIDHRLKEKFPTNEELDYKVSQEDPHAHYELHKND